MLQLLFSVSRLGGDMGGAMGLVHVKLNCLEEEL